MLGIKTTLGQHIAKNFPVYQVNETLINTIEMSFPRKSILWYKHL